MLPEKLKEIRAWLIKAEHDLMAATHLLDVDGELRDVVVYHCQQAAEKALKAYLTWRDSEFAKTHALVQLVEQARSYEDDFSVLMEHAEDLSPFAWRFRYPGDLLDPGEAETDRALAMAGEIMEFVKKRLHEAGE